MFDSFGWSVSVSGNTLVVGAYSEDSAATGVDGDQADNSAMNAGAAYVFSFFPPDAYCTGKTTSGGCVPFVLFSGTPSASSGSFDILSNDHVEAEPGNYLYSVGKASLNFHGGKLCVKAPFHRLTTLIKATDGVPCSGCAGNCRTFVDGYQEARKSDDLVARFGFGFGSPHRVVEGGCGCSPRSSPREADGIASLGIGG